MSSTVSRLGFTTLGIPGAPLAEVADLAGRTGWRGVELRSADDEPVHIGLSADEVDAARRDLAGVTLIATNSYVRFASVERSDGEVVEAALAEARLACLSVRRPCGSSRGPASNPAPLGTPSGSG